MKISVIIPVYNTEKYLHECISSVINQTYNNLEIILINDGSQDFSGAICDDYAKQDSRIKVIHKENGGVSSARNEGLKLASGDYIAYLDSDDSIEPNMYEVLLKAALEKDVDIISCNYMNIQKDKPLVLNRGIDKSEYEGDDVLYSFFKYSILSSAIWNKLYKRNTVKNLYFDVRFSMAEDVLYNFFAFKKSRKIAYVNSPLHRRNVREGSLTTMYFNERYFHSIKARQIIVETLQGSQHEEAARYFLLKRSVDILNRIIVTGQFKEKKHEIIAEIKENKELIFKPTRGKALKVARVLFISQHLYNLIVKIFYKRKGRTGIDLNLKNIKK